MNKELIENIEDWLDADSHANLLHSKIMFSDIEIIAERLAPRIAILLHSHTEEILNDVTKIINSNDPQTGNHMSKSYWGATLREDIKKYKESKLSLNTTKNE